MPKACLSETILIVDDSALVRASLRRTLEQAGLQVVEAGNGREGLAMLSGIQAAGRKLSLIITDVNMPEMDGVTFIKKVRQSELERLPILIFSSESSSATRMAGKSAGASGWLAKPLRPERLLGAVRALISV